MSTDRELLEMAAKAIDLFAAWPKSDYAIDIGDDGIYCYGMGKGLSWNPLEDDGDALRLAVRLDLLILPYRNDRAIRVTRLDQPETIVSFGTPEDEYAATRRAIVRAAAEIGRNMP